MFLSGHFFVQLQFIEHFQYINFIESLSVFIDANNPQPNQVPMIFDVDLEPFVRGAGGYAGAAADAVDAAEAAGNNGFVAAAAANGAAAGIDAGAVGAGALELLGAVGGAPAPVGQQQQQQQADEQL